jgi:hypothetical protein
MKPLDLNAVEVVDFNYLYSAVPKREWYKYADKLSITPYAVLPYAKSLASVFGEDFVVKRLTTAKYLTSDKHFNTMIAVKDIYPKVAEKLKDLYTDAVKESHKNLVIPSLEVKKLILVFDVSGSMEKLYPKLMAMVSPFAPLVKDLILFGEGCYHEAPKKLFSVDETLETLKHAPWKGTNVRGALAEARKSADKEDIIMIVTDEQENVDVDKELINPHIVVNPKPYPSHMPFNTQCVFVPANNAESLASAYRLTQILNLNPTKNLITSISQTRNSFLICPL